MSGPSVVPFWPVARPNQERAMRPKPTSRRPPTYLNAAAKLAWADVARLLGRNAQCSDIELELAAVLLALFRDGHMPNSLLVQDERGLSGARPVALCSRLPSGPYALPWPCPREAPTSGETGSRRRLALDDRALVERAAGWWDAVALRSRSMTEIRSGPS